MKTSTKIITLALAVIVLVGGILAFTHRVPNGDNVLGAASGTDHYNYENFYNGLYAKFFTAGGAIDSISTTSATYTLAQNDLVNYNVIQIAVAQNPGLTLTLPASSTLTTLIPKAGDVREYILYNANTAAATTTTIAGGTGVTLQSGSSTAIIEAGKSAVLRLQRRTTTDITALITLFK